MVDLSTEHHKDALDLAKEVGDQQFAAEEWLLINGRLLELKYLPQLAQRATLQHAFTKQAPVRQLSSSKTGAGEAPTKRDSTAALNAQLKLLKKMVADAKAADLVGQIDICVQNICPSSCVC
jgi:hypothetical protein